MKATEDFKRIRGFLMKEPPWGCKVKVTTKYVLGFNLVCFSLPSLAVAVAKNRDAAGVDCGRLLLSFGGLNGQRTELLLAKDEAASAAK